jgi:RNA binding exosome subunit
MASQTEKTNKVFRKLVTFNKYAAGLFAITVLRICGEYNNCIQLLEARLVHAAQHHGKVCFSERNIS